jgi:hypothetical protein
MQAVGAGAHGFQQAHPSIPASHFPREEMILSSGLGPIGLLQYKSKDPIILSEKVIAATYHVNGMLRSWLFHLLFLSKTIYVLVQHHENFKS